MDDDTDNDPKGIDNDVDVLTDGNILDKYQSELQHIPEILNLIKRLQNCIHKQKIQIRNLIQTLSQHDTERRYGKMNFPILDASTQTEGNITSNQDEAVPVKSLSQPAALWESENHEELMPSSKSFADGIREVAEKAMAHTNFVYEETSGMYYDYSTGYYYNAELGLYYDGNSGIYYYYDSKSETYVFHSQVEIEHPEPAPIKVQSTTPSYVNKPESHKKHKGNHKNIDETKINKKRKLSKPLPIKERVKESENEHSEDEKSSDSSAEEGEIVSETSSVDNDDSASLDDESSVHELEKGPVDYEAAKAWPPCMRIIVKETGLSNLKVGTLFIVTCTGGTLGRETDHVVCIPDINISKHHAKFSFDESLGHYIITDFGSRNGTHLNGKRLSVAKQESEPHEVVHGSSLQVGTTTLLCHIHEGRETCGHCEPGLVQRMNPELPHEPVVEGKPKQKRHKEELKRLRRKFALEGSKTPVVAMPGYEDRAQIRRKTVGSQDHNAKTQTASVHESILPDNKGFKLLSKMGWNEGQSLGKTGGGRTEPVPLETRQGKAGLGASTALLPPPVSPSTERRNAVWRKTQQRYQNIT